MINPMLVEREIATHQADLRREAAVERLVRQAREAGESQGAAQNGEGLRSRLGDLLLAYGLKLKGLDAPSAVPGGAAAIPSGARLALVAAAPLPASAPAVAHLAQPVSGFSLLRYETLPPVGIFFWRLDRLGAATTGRQGYLTLTWLASGNR